MPIDPDKARGARLPDGQSAYTKDQVILYHLGLGAGVPATDPKELEYTYEKNLKVLPSFAVIPSFGSMVGIGSVPGLQFNWAMLLHGEQEVKIHRPLPPEAKIATSAHVPEIYDKGKAALVILETEAKDEATCQPLWTNRYSMFIRGEGGFGGDSGPKVGNAAPDRAPDGTIERKTLPQQALIYRLSGDKNPLHADPEFAKLGGFDTPIIHGLCSYGIACKAIVDQVLGGDVAKVSRYQARFAGVAFPGETYRIKYWKDGAKRILLEAESVERNAKIISNAIIELN